MYGEIMFKDESGQNHTDNQAKDDLAFKCEIGNETEERFDFCLERMKNAVESGLVKIPKGFGRKELRKFLENCAAEANAHRVHYKFMENDDE